MHEEESFQWHNKWKMNKYWVLVFKWNSFFKKVLLEISFKADRLTLPKKVCLEKLWQYCYFIHGVSLFFAGVLWQYSRDDLFHRRPRKKLQRLSFYKGATWCSQHICDDTVSHYESWITSSSSSAKHSVQFNLPRAHCICPKPNQQHCKSSSAPCF